MQTAEARAILARHGRSFAFAARLLPAVSADCAPRLYAVCRSVDDLADRVGGERAARRLAALRRALLRGDAGDPLAAEILALEAERGLDRGAAVALVDGVAGDLGPVRLPDERAMLAYAYRVAGTVGLMMCPVLGVRDGRARRHAVDLGIAMQLTNIARDVAEDAAAGRRYLPGTWIDAAPVRIAEPDHALAREIRGAVLRLLDLAERYYASGAAGYGHLPVRARPGIAAAASIYRAIGTELRRRGGDAHAGRARVSAPRKTLLAAGALRALAARPAPVHDPELHRPLAGLVPPSQGDAHGLA
jgi:phytoene synthase